MESKRGTGATRRKRKTASPAKAGTKAPRGTDNGSFEQAIQRAVTGGGTVSVGLVNLVKNTLVTAISGARDVGGEMGTAAVAAVRGSIRAASEIGADLGAVARYSIMGTIEAAEQIGGELGGAARSATRDAVKTTREVGGDVNRVAGQAIQGTAEAARRPGADVASDAQDRVSISFALPAMSWRISTSVMP